jgi:hypothetical protein
MLMYMDKVSWPAADLIVDNMAGAAGVKVDQLKYVQEKENEFSKTILVAMIIMVVVSVVISGIVHLKTFSAVKDVNVRGDAWKR